MGVIQGGTKGIQIGCDLNTGLGTNTRFYTGRSCAIRIAIFTRGRIKRKKLNDY